MEKREAARWAGIARMAALAGAVLVLLACLACQAGGQGPQKTLPTATISIKGVPVTVEIARSEKEQEMGLMFRKRLADGKGMIFVYDVDKQLSFWMKNTLIPLSIAYIASDGTITDIIDMTPLSTAAVVTSHYVRYALEAPQGWYARSGIHAGDKADLAGLAK
jgi:uncharacterized protein